MSACWFSIFSALLNSLLLLKLHQNTAASDSKVPNVVCRLSTKAAIDSITIGSKQYPNIEATVPHAGPSCGAIRTSKHHISMIENTDIP